MWPHDHVLQSLPPAGIRPAPFGRLVAFLPDTGPWMTKQCKVQTVLDDAVYEHMMDVITVTPGLHCESQYIRDLIENDLYGKTRTLNLIHAPRARKDKSDSV